MRKAFAPILCSLSLLAVACGGADDVALDEPTDAAVEEVSEAGEAVDAGETAEADATEPDDQAPAEEPETQDDTPTDPADEAVPEEDAVTDPEAGEAEPATTEPAIAPGEVTNGVVTIDGSAVEYVTAVPSGFEPGDTAPVLLAFPPGDQSFDLTESLVRGTYANEALRLGWVVVSPAAPEGVRFTQGSEVLLPGFVDWAETWVTPEGGSPHVIGISNGGLSAFRYAGENIDRVQSVVVFPGFPQSPADRDAFAQLTDVPIRMFVGGLDEPWIGPSQDTVAQVEELGGDITLTVFDGEGHVMNSTRDGTVLFEQLESFRTQ